jgi:hypothetical protein
VREPEQRSLVNHIVFLFSGGIESEPLGGNNAYWTHLRAGLVDMLCNLCRQQNRSSCIVRYCSNDLIRTETETPAPSVVITAKQIFWWRTLFHMNLKLYFRVIINIWTFPVIRSKSCLYQRTYMAQYTCIYWIDNMVVDNHLFKQA